jgi:hypothetical protein
MAVLAAGGIVVVADEAVVVLAEGKVVVAEGKVVASLPELELTLWPWAANGTLQVGGSLEKQDIRPPTLTSVMATWSGK